MERRDNKRTSISRGKIYFRNSLLEALGSGFCVGWNLLLFENPDDGTFFRFLGLRTFSLF
jgi:hypothetical protein